MANKLLHALLLASAMACMTPAATEAHQAVKKDSHINNEEAARRIITLAPFLAELVYAAGGGDYLVGVSAHTDYPPAAVSLPVVGDAFSMDIEAILMLKPDLVMAWRSGTPITARNRLAKLGIRVEALDPKQFEDIAEAIRLIGQWTDQVEQAEQAAQSYLSRIEGLRTQFANRPDISVFYQVSRNPLFTLNGEHMASAVIELCGGRNIFADENIRAPQVSLEAVITAIPEVILIGSGNPEDRHAWEEWSTLPAVKNNNIYEISPDELIRQTPRISSGIQTVCGILERARANIHDSGHN